MASRHCDICNLWHDLSEPWPEACMGHYRKRKDRDAHNVMRDIEPYQATFTDKDGQRVVVKSRSQHKDELKARGYTEVGNEYEAATKREERAAPPIKQTMSQALEAWRQGYRPRPMSRQEFDS